MEGRFLMLVLALFAAIPGWVLWLCARRRNTRLREEKARLEREALVDSLTGAFQYGVLRREMASGTASPNGCIFCDLNNLKLTNDTYGHSEGDRLIQAAADAIREVAGGRGRLFRIGGDELVFLPDGEAPPIPELCHKIDAAVERRNAVATLPLSLAVGGAVPAQGTDWDDLLKQAEQAMYRDKKKKKCPPTEGENRKHDDACMGEYPQEGGVVGL